VLRVALLGELSITDDLAGTIRARSARTAALVAFLVLHAGSAQPRHRIAGLFWPESGEAQALTNLRRELHQLRQVLGDEPALVVTGRDLCWQDTATCRVDVRIFDRERRAAAEAGDDASVMTHAARAVAEYRGDLLPGVYDDWVLEARAEIERQCTGLCDLLGQARARSGDLPGAMEAARRRIQLQPLEEHGTRS
jgi:DNA-binding SARP family transcriptional activator